MSMMQATATSMTQGAAMKSTQGATTKVTFCSSQRACSLAMKLGDGLSFECYLHLYSLCSNS